MSREYDQYLTEHRNNVMQGYIWILNHFGDPGLEQIDNMTGVILSTAVHSHDMSKYSAQEYDAYDAYFYGKNKTEKIKENFNLAWLHHIHENPHHWQHWVLMEDNPETGENFKCLEMPQCYVLEMICDWWSFSWKTGNLYEIFDWYEKHKNTIKLHPETRFLVQRWLGMIKFFLDQEKEEEG